MRNDHTIAVIIPVLNEEQSIGNVLDAIPEWVDVVIVADNGSTDDTPRIAEEKGARVVHEPKRGYGSACLRGMAVLESPDVVVFLDGDYSDHPDQMDRLVDPIVSDEVDMVIGSRVLGNAAKGALTPQARYGNMLACFLMRLFWGKRYTDLGPFRAIRYSSLQKLGMADPDYGWTVEMQIKAILKGASSTEAPVDYRQRIGRSKVSGTIRGVIGAGYKILSTIFLSAFHDFMAGKDAHSRACLIVFTRYPEPGKTKTRLIPALGAEGAADLQKKMTEHMLREVWPRGSKLPLYHAERTMHVYFAGSTEEKMREWLGEKITLRDQGDGGLGDRMKYAFASAKEDGFDRIVIIGIDCPEVSADTIDRALACLYGSDVVLGPATDGGYYLIGLRTKKLDAALESLFDEMPWGTEEVLEETIRRSREAELKHELLAPLDDVDRPEDLHVWERSKLSKEEFRLSIIIPTLNEATCLGATLASIGSDPRFEIIVVDAHSTDATCDIARETGATVYLHDGGRAAQMNLGSAKASGTLLLFLHADTQLPEGYFDEIESLIGSGGAQVGAFSFASDSSSWSMRFVAWGVNLRSRWFRMPYGDQGLFLSKWLFRHMQGFPVIPIMEDYSLVRDLRRVGSVKTSKKTIVTSARRWKRLGPFRTVLYNQLIVAGYRIGISPESLARFYRRNA